MPEPVPLFDKDGFPVRSVRIQGVPARAIVRPLRVNDEYRSVKDAADVDRERGNPADVNHCPLCGDHFGPEAFHAHAASCINTYAPRWERERDAEPRYAGPSRNGGAKRFGKRIIVPGYNPAGDGDAQE